MIEYASDGFDLETVIQAKNNQNLYHFKKICAEDFEHLIDNMTPLQFHNIPSKHMRDVEAGLYEPERKIRIVGQNDIQKDLEEMNKCIDMLIEPGVQSMKGLKPS